jgi:hypothetical protein
MTEADNEQISKTQAPQRHWFCVSVLIVSLPDAAASLFMLLEQDVCILELLSLPFTML